MTVAGATATTIGGKAGYPLVSSREAEYGTRSVPT